jgi:hypothetical protein
MQPTTGRSVRDRGRRVEGTVERVRALERTLAAIDMALQQVGWVGPLYLAYKRREGGYEWRRRGIGRFATYVGRKVPGDLLAGLRRTTRAKVRAVEQLLEARVIGKTLLRLMESIVADGGSWPEDVVTVMWTHNGEGSYSWICPLGGGVLGQSIEWWGFKELRTYREIVRPYVGRLTSATPVADAVRRWAGGVGEMEARLVEAREALRTCRLRLYYDGQSQTWRFRRLRRGRPSVPVKDVLGGYAGRVPEWHWRVIERTRNLIEQQQRLRRAVELVGTLAGLSALWLDGRWQLRGDRRTLHGAEGGVAWVWTAAQGRVLKRVYERR